MPILVLCGAAAACNPATEAEVTSAGIPLSEPVTNFPRRIVPASGWTAGGEAVIAGRLIVANGCLSLASDGQIRPIVWHRDARLAADGRRVVDMRTGRSVSVGETIALAGGVYDRPRPGAASETYRDFPEKCVGNKIIVVGEGFHS
jgi:hypothetical protein